MRLDIVLRDTLAVLVHSAESEMGTVMTFLGG
jgi:hypothetical protein